MRFPSTEKMIVIALDVLADEHARYRHHPPIIDYMMLVTTIIIFGAVFIGCGL